jgi:hypothetical protein
MSHFSGQGRKAVPIGTFRHDLAPIAAIAMNRIRSVKVVEWILWHDTQGNIYLGDVNSRSAQEVLMKNPQLRICTYRITKLYRVTGSDILDDLQDAAARFFVRDSAKEAA